MNERRRFNVYISSALGYSVPTRIFYTRTLLPTLRGNGFTVLDPWEVGPADRRPGAASAGQKAVDLIGRADAVLAVLDGADIDGGTGAEVGYAIGLGLPVVGWRSDVRTAGERGELLGVPLDHMLGMHAGSVHTDLGTAIDALVRLRATAT